MLFMAIRHSFVRSFVRSAVPILIEIDMQSQKVNVV